MRPARSRPHAARLRRGLLLVIVGLTAVLGAPGPALAHSGLTSSSPAAGSTVTEPLSVVSLTFSGRVRPREVTVAGPDGAPAGSGPATASGSVVDVPVRLTAAGRYTIDYTVASDDGHPVVGTVTFTYTPPVAAAQPPPAAPGTATAAPTARETPAVLPGDGVGATAATATGLPGWTPAAAVGVVVVLGGVLLARRRARRH